MQKVYSPKRDERGEIVNKNQYDHAMYHFLLLLAGFSLGYIVFYGIKDACVIMVSR